MRFPFLGHLAGISYFLPVGTFRGNQRPSGNEIVQDSCLMWYIWDIYILSDSNDRIYFMGLQRETRGIINPNKNPSDGKNSEPNDYTAVCLEIPGKGSEKGNR